MTLYRYVGLSINGRCSDMRENIQLPKSVLSIGQTTKWVVSVCPTHQGRHTAVEHVPEKHRPLGEWTLELHPLGRENRTGHRRPLSSGR